MPAPRVAVVVPSYNHGRFIEEALTSAIRQTRPPDEIHVIDDGSVDDSVAIIERVLGGAGAIRCSLRVQRNQGISATRNALVEGVSADYVAFLDSDDTYAPDRLERLLVEAPADGRYMAFSGVSVSTPAGVDLDENWSEAYRAVLAQSTTLPTAGFALLRSNLAMSASNFVVGRRLLEEIGPFDERIGVCQDWDLAVRALPLVEPVFVPEPLLVYRRHADNTSRVARENVDDEIGLVFENVRRWMLTETPNSQAPTPVNWPRFFRVFAHVCHAVKGGPLASWLPTQVPAGLLQDRPNAREGEALRRLVDGARGAQATNESTAAELMRRCHQVWTSAR